MEKLAFEISLYNFISFILERATDVAFCDIENENTELLQAIEEGMNKLITRDKQSDKETLGMFIDALLKLPVPLWQKIINAELTKPFLNSDPEIVQFFTQELEKKGIYIKTGPEVIPASELNKKPKKNICRRVLSYFPIPCQNDNEAIFKSNQAKLSQ